VALLPLVVFQRTKQIGFDPEFVESSHIVGHGDIATTCAQGAVSLCLNSKLVGKEGNARLTTKLGEFAKNSCANTQVQSSP
jgi:hypothetical protein